MPEKMILKAEKVIIQGQTFHHPPFDIELRAGQGGLVIANDLDLLRGLMKCCLGLENPARGRLSWWDGRGPGVDKNWELYDFYRQIGYVDRQSQLLGALPLREHFLLFSRYDRKGEAIEESDRLVNLFGLASYLDYPGDYLPEPQRRLALYALAFCRRPLLLLMERPAQFLDRDFHLVWRLVLKRAKEFGLAYLVFDRNENIYASERFDATVPAGQTSAAVSFE